MDCKAEIYAPSPPTNGLFNGTKRNKIRREIRNSRLNADLFTAILRAANGMVDGQNGPGDSLGRVCAVSWFSMHNMTWRAPQASVGIYTP